MKHRTVTVFIVVLAALTAVPQTFEQLSSLKNAAGDRLTAGVWSAFLSLNGQKVAGGGARARELPQAGRLLGVNAPESLPQTAQGSRRSVVRPSKSGEKAQPAAQTAGWANAEEALGVAARELAMLGGLDELISVEAGPQGRVLVRAPKAPALTHNFVPASMPAPRAEALPAVFKFDKVMKGTSLKRLHERLRVEDVRRAAAAEKAGEAEAPHAAEYAWSLDQNRPSGRAPSCDAETDQQLTN